MVPAKIDLVGVEIELIQMIARERVLKKALANFRNDYDYILIDCPPSLGLLTVNALTAADGVIIPVQCEYYALEGLSALTNTIKLIKQELNPDLTIEGVLLTMYDTQEQPGGTGGPGSAQVLREQGVYDRHSPERGALRGAEPRQAGAVIRHPVPRRPELPGSREGGHQQCKSRRSVRVSAR